MSCASLLLVGLGVTVATSTSRVTAGDYSGPREASNGYASARIPPEVYARAERFLSWNKERYVRNADIQHHWIGNQDRFWYLRANAALEREFVVVDATTGQRTAAFDHRKLAAALSAATSAFIPHDRLPFSTFRFMPDETAIMFQFSERLWTCELATGTCRASAAPRSDETLSPDGRFAAFVRDHNIWIRATSSNQEFPLTTDGVEHHGYGGTPGYSTYPANGKRRGKPAVQVVWSPDSRFLLTHRLDERRVQESFLIQSVPDDGSMRPKLHKYRYAIAGEEHVPMVEPLVLEVTARKAVKLATSPLICPPQTPIETRAMWWSADGRTIYYLNRDRFSKSVALYRADPHDGAVNRILNETSNTVVQTNANNIFDVPLVRTLQDGTIIWYSQRDGWGHLYLYDRNGTLRNRITSGDWAVRDIIRVDQAAQTLYFMASGREPHADPYEQRLYSIQLDGTGLRLLTPEPGDHSRPHPLSKSLSHDTLSTEAERESFSHSGRYVVDSYSRPDVPPVLVVRAADGHVIKQIEQADISKLQADGYVAVEPFRVLAADGKTSIYGNLFRPSDFDPAKKYPVIDANYSGPQMIRSGKTFSAASFGNFEAQSLAELGFIVVTIDGRGTPNRSKAFLDYSYGRLHKASDLEDHIAGIRQLAHRYPYMDLDRAGIDGVSGGGFMAARAILAYPDFYKVAVAAEGNQDQRGYLATWGETYNGPHGLMDDIASSTVPIAANLRGKLLLMHGEMDDDVPPALTMRLVDALIKANRDFDLLILPNEDHAAFLTSPYFIRRKWDYFVRHLLGAEPPVNYAVQSLN